MSETIRQHDVNAAAWAACDTFRGAVDPAQYKDYILVTLFVKYVSDIWAEHYEQYREEYGDDEERIRRRLGRERFVLPKGSSYYDLYAQRGADNIGELINEALYALEDANKAKLAGVFRNIDFNSEANLGKVKDRNRRLKNLLEDFHKPQLDLHPSRVPEDVIGNTYIYLIERFATDAGKKAGEFYTPHAVSELVARLAAPQPGGTICDPACGSGGLLIEAARAVGTPDFALYGMEVNGGTWALARMNMFLHHADSADIEWCDTLNSPALVEGDRLKRFDVVVANPPFSLDKWGAEEAANDRYNRYWRGVPPRSKGDWAFITHMVEVAREREGRVAVVVPHGVLFRGAAEKRIRRHMIEENLLDAVIGLPAGLFPTTGIPVAVLVFDRAREKGGRRAGDTDVLFIDASKEFTPGKAKNTLAAEHIERVLSTHAERADADKYAHVVPASEIVENDFNLNIPRYVDTFEEPEPIDIVAVQAEIEQLEAELAEVRAKMKEIMKEMLP